MKLYDIPHSSYLNPFFSTFPMDCRMRLLPWLLLFNETVLALTLSDSSESFLPPSQYGHRSSLICVWLHLISESLGMLTAAKGYSSP